MATTKVFRSGNSQAVRIPKAFRIESDEVEIRREGDAIVLRPPERSWAPLFESLDKFTEDFMSRGRRQTRVERRRQAFR